MNDNSIEASSDAFMMRAGEDPSSSCRPSNNNLCTSTGFTCFVGEICSSYNMTLCERPRCNRRAMSHWFRKEMHTIGHCVKARLDGAIILKPLFMCQNGACEMAGCSSPWPPWDPCRRNVYKSTRIDTTLELICNMKLGLLSEAKGTAPADLFRNNRWARE